MNKTIKTIITTISILLISINSVFANSINFKKLNNPGYQNQIKARYGMHEVVENCYFNSETGDMLASTKDVTMAYIGKKCYFVNKLVQYNNGKIKLADFGFKKDSISLLRDVTGINVVQTASYLLSINYCIEYGELYKENFAMMTEAREQMEKALASEDVDSFNRAKESFYEFKETADKAYASALEYEKMIDKEEARLNIAIDLFQALITSRGDVDSIAEDLAVGLEVLKRML